MAEHQIRSVEEVILIFPFEALGYASYFYAQLHETAFSDKAINWTATMPEVYQAISYTAERAVKKLFQEERSNEKYL
jgi:hypothetical protein